VSVVVTDVKDYSDLTRQFPDIMQKAMGIHNAILRKACHSHAGAILDQEVRLRACLLRVQPCACVCVYGAGALGRATVDAMQGAHKAGACKGVAVLTPRWVGAFMPWLHAG
jgi:hypothetical protein